MTALWACLAGGLGALARFGLDGSVRARWSSEFPWATLLVNASGSLLLGLVTGLVLFQGSPSALATVAGTGFCGGYTTFSTVSFESVRLAQQGRLQLAWYNSAANLVITVTAGAAGLGMARL